jgi:hypothetical protein
MRIRPWQVISVSVWTLCLAGGAGYLAAHASTPGDTGRTPDRWRPDLLPRADGRWTIVLAAHPRCPCTRATADELVAAIDGAPTPYELLVLAYRPDGPETGAGDFTATGVIRRLAALPHARIVDDPNGRLAAALGANTSGHAAVYDPDGLLRFTGGLTPTRAHVGPNTGAAALRALLRNDPPPAAVAPVYGCPLDNTAGRPDAGPLGGCTAEGDHACTP